jgi:4-hydroxy-tetrahydrodipicolinate synthase
LYDESVPHLHGVVVALLTPFREDERIDYGAWQHLIDRLIAAGVHGLFVGGSTGESAAQTLEERTTAIRFVRQAAAGHVPVYANVGCITTRDTISLALAAQSEGVDVLAVVTPYYIRPSQPELADHYVEVCRAVNLPVLAYNFPQHGGAELLPDTLRQIANRCENLAGIKDSSGRIETLRAYLDTAPPREWSVFVGPENVMVPALQAGSVGVVSGCANIAPALFVDLYRAHRDGNATEAARLQTLATQLSEAAGLHTFPSIIKEAVGNAGRCRRPIGPVPAEAREKLSHVLAALKREGYLPQTPNAVTA